MDARVGAAIQIITIAIVTRLTGIDDAVPAERGTWNDARNQAAWNTCGNHSWCGAELRIRDARRLGSDDERGTSAHVSPPPPDTFQMLVTLPGTTGVVTLLITVVLMTGADG
jgi:hypothetical protein